MSREVDLAMQAAEEIMRLVSGMPASVIAGIIRRVVVEPMNEEVAMYRRIAADALEGTAKVLNGIADATGETRNEAEQETPESC